MFARDAFVLTLISTCLLVSGCAVPPASVTAEAVTLEPLGQPLPQSAARSALIERIIANDAVVVSAGKPVLAADTNNDARIAALKKADSVRLPEAYWALYKQNLEAMQYDLNHQHDAARDQYVAAYRDELNRVDDGVLQKLASGPQALDDKSRRQWGARMAQRTLQYMIKSDESFRAATKAHLDRMALMDRRYDVCLRKADCWDAPAQ